MTRALLLIAAMATVAGCSRLTDSHGGRVAPGSRGPAMVGVVNPAGHKIPAAAVSAVPSGGYWNCRGDRPEHAARCTLHSVVPRAKR